MKTTLAGDCGKLLEKVDEIVALKKKLEVEFEKEIKIKKRTEMKKVTAEGRVDELLGWMDGVQRMLQSMLQPGFKCRSATLQTQLEVG